MDGAIVEADQAKAGARRGKRGGKSVDGTTLGKVSRCWPLCTLGARVVARQLCRQPATVDDIGKCIKCGDARLIGACEPLWHRVRALLLGPHCSGCLPPSHRLPPSPGPWLCPATTLPPSSQTVVELVRHTLTNIFSDATVDRAIAKAVEAPSVK